MKIGTFGSCLSRRTADRLARMVGGSIVTSVFHNRSDQFLRCHREGFPSAKSLISLLDGAEHGRLRQEPILINQSRDGLGLHRLESALPFLDALRQIDILLVDNYMDLSAFLWRAGDIDFFSTAPLEDRYERLPFIDPVFSAQNFSVICSEVRGTNPKAAIAFLPFPHDAYEDGGRRAEWNDRFLASLALGDIAVLPLFKIPHSQRIPGKPHHFHRATYELYALKVLEAMSLRPPLLSRACHFFSKTRREALAIEPVAVGFA